MTKVSKSNQKEVDWNRPVDLDKRTIRPIPKHAFHQTERRTLEIFITSRRKGMLVGHLKG